MYESGWKAGLHFGMGMSLILCGLAGDHRGWIAGGAIFVLHSLWLLAWRGGAK